MTGSPRFLIEKIDFFEKSFKKLVKSYKSNIQQQEFARIIASFLEKLTIDPYPPQSRIEPLPGGIKLPNSLKFCKLVVTIAKGASGQIRLIYLVNEEAKIIKLQWIYSHEEFPKRPPDKDLKDIIKAILEENE